VLLFNKPCRPGKLPAREWACEVFGSEASAALVWARALDGAGLVGIHIHDLRHTGNHFAAMTGASTRELMGRMCHASMDVALIYQHRTDRRRALDRLCAQHGSSVTSSLLWVGEAVRGRQLRSSRRLEIGADADPFRVEVVRTLTKRLN
jgi:hypothetical protein